MRPAKTRTHHGQPAGNIRRPINLVTTSLADLNAPLGDRYAALQDRLAERARA